MEPIEITDEALVISLQMGDEAAFTVIYKRYWYRMFVVANRKLQNRELAEEVIQEIFTRLWRERYSQQINNLSYFLFAAVRYEVIDLIRLHGNQDRYQAYYQAFSVMEDYNTEETVAFNDLLKTVDDGLSDLPEKSREIFRLRRFDEWPVAKIAAHFDLSEKAVEYHISKATKSIRAHLKQTIISLALLLSPFVE